jgi:hypothetical protein
MMRAPANPRPHVVCAVVDAVVDAVVNAGGKRGRGCTMKRGGS